MAKTSYLIRLLILMFVILGLPAGALAAPKQYVVVIDAGHGGKDAGACDNNVKEKDINLGVALKLGEMIKKHLKNVKVVYTRDDDTFVTLQGRADKSNKAKADLFISIHTNSVAETNPNRRTVAGASVYTLGPQKDEANMEVARRENSVIELEKNYDEKYSGFDPNSDESYILFEMAQKKNLKLSLRLARDIQNNLVKEAQRADRGVHQAGFWVLWATSAPAVLVELDFICNPNSAKYIASGTGQERLAKGIFKAVEDYISYLEADTHSDDRLTASAEEPDVPSMTRERRSDRQDTPDHTASGNAAKPTSQQPTTVARRRRNSSAREASNNRQVEVTQIIIASEEETATLSDLDEEDSLPESTSGALTEQSAEHSAEVAQAVAESPRQEENPMADEVPAKPQDTEANKPVLESRATASNAASPKPRQRTQTPGQGNGAADGRHHVRVEKMRTVYRIQIVVSDTELKESSPLFAGLSPVTVFKEHGLYKYTYGESESRAEMERLLKEVRQLIPDAMIIKSRKCDS